jgi:hypothetical protein
MSSLTTNLPTAWEAEIYTTATEIPASTHTTATHTETIRYRNFTPTLNSHCRRAAINFNLSLTHGPLFRLT